MTVDVGIREDSEIEREAPSWHKAEPTILAASTNAEQALADIVQRCLTHLRRNEPCVLQRAHDEGVHQMRVAVRRLRSSLALFHGLIPEEQRKYLNRELRWLINELGPARDWDVFIAETYPPVAAQLPNDPDLRFLRQSAERMRAQAYDRVSAALGSPRYMGIIMLLSASTVDREWHGPVGTVPNPDLQEPAIELANHLLERRYTDVLTAGGGFADLEPEDRHRLRIQVKKLRYATEFFGSLYPKPRLRSYLAALKMLQEQLGSTNDIEVAQLLLRGIAKGAPRKDRLRLAYAAGLVIGWHSHVADGRESRSNQIWERFRESSPYWRTLAADGAGSEKQVNAIGPADREGSGDNGAGA